MKRSDISDATVVVACWAAVAKVKPSNRIDSLDTLVGLTGAPEKVAVAAMERAHSRSLIDYGVCIGRAWPTPEGFKLKREENPK